MWIPSYFSFVWSFSTEPSLYQFSNNQVSNMHWVSAVLKIHKPKQPKKNNKKKSCYVLSAFWWGLQAEAIYFPLALASTSEWYEYNQLFVIIIFIIRPKKLLVALLFLFFHLYIYFYFTHTRIHRYIYIFQIHPLCYFLCRLH